MKTKTLAILLVLALVIPVVAQEKSGIATAQFLKIGIGPRMIGMGSAVVATGPADASIAFWNPAGLSRVPGVDVFFEDNEWIADTRMMSGAAAINFDQVGTFGVTFQYLDYGDMDKTTQDDQDGSLGTFGASDMAVGLVYARRLTDRFAVGGRVQYIRSAIDEYSMQTWAVDVGTLYDTGFKSLRVGMALQYFGADAAFDGEYGERRRDGSGYDTTPFNEAILPMTFRIGVAYDLLEGEDHFLTMGLDAIHPNDADERLHVGVEYTMFNIASLRVGYQANYDFFTGDQDEDSFAPGLTAGVGVNVPLGRTESVRVDASYSDMGRLGYALRFGLGFSL